LGFSVIFFIMIGGVATYVRDMNHLAAIKWQIDQAQHTASSGLGHLLAYLESQPNAPSIQSRTEVEDDAGGHRVDLPDGASYELHISPSDSSLASQRRYLLESTASYWEETLGRTVNCRAQVEVTQESFAKYEQFVDFADAWDSPYLKEYQDFGTIGLGPIHSNSGCNIFSSCLFAKPVTSGASGSGSDNPARFYPDIWSMYYWVRNNDPASQNYVNVAGPQPDLGYPYETIFYGGLSVNEPTIDLPGVGNNTEDRTRALRENSQINLPADDTAAEPPRSQAYPKGTNGDYMYVLEFSDPSGSANNGQVTVKQYLGWKSAEKNDPGYKVADYRTVGTYDLDSSGQGILVSGDIIGIRGVIDGRVTVGAIDHPDGGIGGGNIYVTGQLQYESRMNYSDGEGNPFEFPDRNQLTSGGQLNEDYYASLGAQVGGLDDILGIVADGSVLVPEGAESGGAAAFRTNGANKKNPKFNKFKGTVDLIAANGTKGSPSSVPSGANRFFLDGIVMSTGYNGPGATFEAINSLYRKHGWIHTLGGIATLRRPRWNLFTGSTWTGGIQRYKYWDMRMSDPTQAPPFFPLTGNWTIVDGTWDMVMLGSGS